MFRLSDHRERAFIEARVVRVVRVAELGECWEWTAAKTSRGYGHFRVLVSGQPRYVKAHRAAYEIFTAESLGDLEATHRCDNTCCCNPAHIVPGSHQDNMDDMKRKGRAVGFAGESNPKARLTLDQVSEIRSSRAKAPVLAKRFGMCAEQIRRIRRGDNWPANAA